MNEMTEKYFKKEFSYMFDDESKMEPFTLFGFETHEGWNSLLFNLFNIIAILDIKKNVRVRQVKTKLASLRFYIDWIGEDKSDQTREKIYEIIDIFETISEKTCEECGEPGSRRSINHWLWTLCDDCYLARIYSISAKKEEEEKLLVSGVLQPEDI